MTIPRRVVPGTTYLITRRTLDRRFYLQPSTELNRIYEYALASAAQKHGVLVHAFSCLSDHPHDVVTDVRGVLPDFTRDFHREVALAAKVLYGIPENVWAAEPPSAVELHAGPAQFEAALYTLANPVSAGLVAHASEWPGPISLPGIRTIHAQRPASWFSDARPDVVTLDIVPPPAWSGSEDDWHRWLTVELAKREESIAAERRQRGKGFLGRRRVLARKPFDRPQNPDQLAPTRNPVLKTAGDRTLMHQLIAQLRDWRRAYREARARWMIDKSCGFPLGTWWVVQRAGAVLA